MCPPYGAYIIWDRCWHILIDPAVTWYMVKRPYDMQDGYFLVLQDKTAIHNVSGSQPSTSYTVFPGIDLPGYYDIKHVRLPATDSPDTNFSCSTNSYAPNITQVNECADLNPGGVCCIDTAPYQVGTTVLSNVLSCREKWKATSLKPSLELHNKCSLIVRCAVCGVVIV